MTEGPGTRAVQDLDVFLEETQRWAETQLERFLPPADLAPRRLHEAQRYAALGGGKRLRPALVRLFCGWFGGRDEVAARPAAAVELIHTYSLVHDDLPCMDDDDLRRGRATCHVVYGEALGTLVGDGLQALAFEVLAGAPERGAEMCAVLAVASGSRGMVGGQVLDLESEGSADCRREGVEGIHRWKTAVLFGAACELGALAAGAPAGDRAGAREYGELLGLAFQAVDDVLDEVGDARTLGKTPGKDRASEKATLVAALGLEGARVEARRLTQLAEKAAGKLGARGPDLPMVLLKRLIERGS